MSFLKIGDCGLYDLPSHSLRRASGRSSAGLYESGKVPLCHGRGLTTGPGPDKPILTEIQRGQSLVGQGESKAKQEKAVSRRLRLVSGTPGTG